MLHRILRHARANAVAYVALFVALGGTALAAQPQLSQLPGLDFLRAGGDLTGHYPNPSIAPNAVTGGKVAANTLTGADIDESTLGTVPDSAKLGGLGPSSFLQTSDTAGGDLSGPFSNLQVRPDALTGADIDESTLGQVPSAADAAKLGGTPASAYLKSGDTLSATSLSALPHTVATAPAQTIGNLTQTDMALSSLSGTPGFSLDGHLLKVDRAGLYLVTAGVEWEQNATGFRALQAGTTIGNAFLADVRNGTNGPADTVESTTTLISLPADAEIEVTLSQSSGGDLATRVVGDDFNRLELVWLGPAS